MADVTLPIADASGFIPQLWANKALDVLRSQLVLAKTVAKDIDFNETATYGKSITVPYPGTFTAVKKAANTPLTPQAPTGGASVTVTLNNHASVPFNVEDFANAQANQSLMSRYLEPATIAIAEQFETDLWTAAAQVGTIAPVGVQGTPVSSATLRTMLGKANSLKMPMNDRHVVLSPFDQAALLGDTTIQNFFAFSQPGVVVEGLFGRGYGFNFHMSQLTPTGYTATVGAASAGTFTLTVGGQTTSALAYNATVATVQAALQALSSVGAGQASVSGQAGTYSIVLTGTAAGQAITGTGTGLTGGAFAINATAANKNLAYHRNAVMYAVRPFDPIPASAGVMTATANDPESGLSLRIAAQYDINNAAMRVNVDMLYGVVPLRTNQGIIIDS